MKLFLIGLPGSGKSTLAKELSKKLKYPFTDTDELICKKEGSSIEEIFINKGENNFRKIESDILKELVRTNGNAIISTGGGTPCFFDNMEIINQHFPQYSHQKNYEAIDGQPGSEQASYQGKEQGTD
jgi:shikimate kinase